MQRLIDADAYAAEMRKRQENCRAWKDGLVEGTELYARAEQSLMTFVESALTLKSQPTIDAIPVEWLKRRRDIYLKAYHAGHESEIHTAAILNDTLMAWRKEQKEQEART